MSFADPAAIAVTNSYRLLFGIQAVGSDGSVSHPGSQMSVWQRWVRQPQSLWLRRALFQVHLWTGIGVGLYVFMICITGSALVYRNELFRAATPAPVIQSTAGGRLTDDQLRAAAVGVYPGYAVTSISRPRNPNRAVDLRLARNGTEKHRLFDPYTGKDLGDAVPRAFLLVTGLLDLHDNLLAGSTGRAVNGIGAIFLLVLCLSGAVIWWPGIGKWRRSLWPEWKANWRRLNWGLHSAFGFWFFFIVLLWGITGIYLCFPATISDWADVIQPLTPENAGERGVDTVMYWLAYLHFGRFGGRIPGCGPVCNSTFKATWALLGLTPPVMFVTGALIWWNRVLRPRGREIAAPSPKVAASTHVAISGPRIG